MNADIIGPGLLTPDPKIDTGLLNYLAGDNMYIRTSSKPRDTVVQNIGKSQKLTIHYKNGAEYNVSNAMDIAVIKRTGGGFDISYVVGVDYKDDLGGITETGKGTLAYETHTGDVVAITSRQGKSGDVRATEYLEFGGK